MSHPEVMRTSLTSSETFAELREKLPQEGTANHVFTATAWFGARWFGGELEGFPIDQQEAGIQIPKLIQIWRLNEMGQGLHPEYGNRRF